ncbi:deoxynucleoside kinase [Aquisalimonas asiatica]|uniref:Deoxyadenosine/deoxycytidine kinase n=1 Tax=Aquisalimonas asiatica TaxID=406100 RepID=A0A1H8T007_9GAMM|nr:deoxynucleoside kinase [Aquisalimonas asiatica]SEO84076.1 Deoxyadenosine/deoxycytidine kinase [Aquisalimonas asiatica]
MAREETAEGGFRIEICGGIASGKTTLASVLQDCAMRAMFEDFSSNPFYEKFYLDPEKYAFETEMVFLLQHYSLIRDQVELGELFCADFSILQDEAYANVNLGGERLRTFNEVVAQVRREIGGPDILVKLVCSPREEKRRMERRSRSVEVGVPVSYLSEINSKIDEEVKRVSGSVKVVTIDSERENFASDPHVRRRIGREIRDMVVEGGRE